MKGCRILIFLTGHIASLIEELTFVVFFLRFLSNPGAHAIGTKCFPILDARQFFEICCKLYSNQKRGRGTSEQLNFQCMNAHANYGTFRMRGQAIGLLLRV